MNLSQMNLTDLKALAYDTLVQLERAQGNLKVINQEIANKLKETQMTEEEVVVAPEVTEEAPAEVAEEVVAESAE